MVKISPIIRSICSIDLPSSFKIEASLYFHWPFCKNICTFCNFNKYVKSDSKFGPGFDDKLGASLQRETQTVLKLTGIKKVKSIYFGGGTPSLAPTKTISQLISHVKQLTKFDKTVEVTIECNPSSSLDLTKTLEEYSQSGVNRVSVGLQSLNDRTLKLLGRDHSANDGLLLLKRASDIFGPNAVSVDLLYRKPGDTVQSWKNELAEVLSYQPSHISLYELTPERGTRLFKQLKSGAITLPGEDDAGSMYLTALELFDQHFFERYEVSSFSKVPSAQSSHNSSYWDGTQYIGIGPGAHSRFFPLDSKIRESRVQCLDPKLWHEMVARDGHGTQVRKQQSQLEILSELLATSMRTKIGVQQKRWYIFQPHYSLKDVFERAPKIQMLCENGNLLWGVDGSLRATNKGLNVIDSILPDVIEVLNEFFKNE